ncbi:unnamed protein product [Moneuplotes crassus]|uniref:Uncharacterized protein n=1 Tax=Euplotes crassus TaxID=5936 RepID=A0AAD1UKD7_EUPCR|nr:unnamed protein product [Moneuplotes crassus]
MGVICVIILGVCLLCFCKIKADEVDEQIEDHMKGDKDSKLSFDHEAHDEENPPVKKKSAKIKPKKPSTQKVLAKPTDDSSVCDKSEVGFMPKPAVKETFTKKFVS